MLNKNMFLISILTATLLILSGCTPAKELVKKPQPMPNLVMYRRSFSMDLAAMLIQ